jgi:hypothetical protein
MPEIGFVGTALSHDEEDIVFDCVCRVHLDAQ